MLDGETDAATLACWEFKADCTAGGTETPGGRLRPSAQSTRMASKPEREFGFPSGLPGVGVVERPEASSSDLRLVVEDFLPRSQDML